MPHPAEVAYLFHLVTVLFSDCESDRIFHNECGIVSAAIASFAEEAGISIHLLVSIVCWNGSVLIFFTDRPIEVIRDCGLPWLACLIPGHIATFLHPRGRGSKIFMRVGVINMTVTVENIIDVENLQVSYGKQGRQTNAVSGLSFSVRRGETVGFIGPNGAGKSSTIKTIMGFIFPKSGAVRVFGQPAGTVAARLQTGYLPEVSLYYPFMKAREILELYGGLQGLDKATLRRRIPELLEKVGLPGKGEVLMKNFSKGMQQRVGIAQAIIADPDLLVFDELSSGLDPVGRYDLREVLLDLKRRGKTIFFSSHELYEVETLCDRVVMINQGQKLADENVADLMGQLCAGDHAQQPVSLEQYFMGLIRPGLQEVRA